MCAPFTFPTPARSPTASTSAGDTARGTAATEPHLPAVAHLAGAFAAIAAASPAPASVHRLLRDARS